MADPTITKGAVISAPATTSGAKRISRGFQYRYPFRPRAAARCPTIPTISTANRTMTSRVFITYLLRSRDITPRPTTVRVDDDRLDEAEIHQDRAMPINVTGVKLRISATAK